MPHVGGQEMKKIIPFICLTIILGGCSMTTNGNQVEEKEKKVIQGKANMELNADDFVRVQDYTGNGFKLRNAERTQDIIKGKEEEIKDAVVEFFQTTYKTEIKVQAIHPAVDGAAVYVESIGEPHFYTFAVVPVDLSKKSIQTDKVFTQSGKVEKAIVTAMYAMMYEEEFSNLNNYIESLVKNNPVTGLPIEAVASVKANGHSNSYYFLESARADIKEPLDAYLENPEITKEEIKARFFDYFNPEDIIIAITLYMRENDLEPDKNLFNSMLSDIQTMDNLPPGLYGIELHDNLINSKVANATKANSISTKDTFLKE